ncbi:hypothetical protein JOC78_000320 [Bacillus ectoiniformans]|nr:hypothetical protein [Bacillus ectoiniformans]
MGKDLGKGRAPLESEKPPIEFEKPPIEFEKPPLESPNPPIEPHTLLNELNILLKVSF